MVSIIAFIGPSASGKSTLRNMMNLNKIVTYTTRVKRDNEIDGIDYNYITKEEMFRMKAKGELLEMSEYNKNFYGTSISSLVKVIERKDISTIIVDENGSKKLKSIFKDNILIIGVIASIDECEERMRIRGNKEDDIILRLSTYQSEKKGMEVISDIILNNDRVNWNVTKKEIERIREVIVSKAIL